MPPKKVKITKAIRAKQHFEGYLEGLGMHIHIYIYVK